MFNVLLNLSKSQPASSSLSFCIYFVVLLKKKMIERARQPAAYFSKVSNYLSFAHQFLVWNSFFFYLYMMCKCLQKFRI